MARSLDQILAELGTTYDPQINNLRAQQALIPDQIASDEQGLQAKQSQAFDEIVNGARRRGLGFSGIPSGEQAKYNATEYMPALARLKQQGRQQALSLEDAILGVQEKRNTLAQQLRQGEVNFDEQQRQFNENLNLQKQQLAAQRAAANSFSPTLQGNNPASATAVQRADKGFDFRDARGQPISAAAYAAAKGIQFRDLLQQMANSGDNGAKQALGFVGNDFGYDPKKVVNPQLASIYNSLVWGTNRQAQVPVQSVPSSSKIPAFSAPNMAFINPLGIR